MERARGDLAAGDFGDWLDDLRAALRGERDATVPCDGCTACCTAGQFVHIDPDELDVLASIPAKLLFPAPGMPTGHTLMGYDEHGACPMFVSGACSIYEHRPRACRMYDCRVFAAAGVDPSDDGPMKRGVAERVVRWRFTYSSEHDRDLHAAACAAASEHHAAATATQRAVQAVRSTSGRQPPE